MNPGQFQNFAFSNEIASQNSLVHHNPNFPSHPAGSRGCFGSFLNFLRVCMDWVRCSSRENRRNVVNIDPPRSLLVHGVGSPARPRPGFSKRGKMKEECFAPCGRKKKGTQTAREGRTSEPETPPKVPGDDPVGGKKCFGKPQQ